MTDMQRLLGELVELREENAKLRNEKYELQAENARLKNENSGLGCKPAARKDAGFYERKVKIVNDISRLYSEVDKLRKEILSL